jgi:hypothetical protein
MQTRRYTFAATQRKEQRKLTPAPVMVYSLPPYRFTTLPPAKTLVISNSSFLLLPSKERNKEKSPLQKIH